VHSSLLLSLLNPESFLNGLSQHGSWVVVGVVLAMVFAECGLLVGFFLPGDSLLFTAGLLVATGTLDFNIIALCFLISIAAVAGNFVGYWIGRKAGPRIFSRPDSRLFREEYVDRTNHFFEGYGPSAIILARFVPIVRTFITVMAGASKMSWPKYAVYSTIGGVAWAFSVTLLGYFLGNVEFIKNNIELIFILIVAISVIPIYFELRRHRAREAND
jgi:membrane-associated protein